MGQLGNRFRAMAPPSTMVDGEEEEKVRHTVIHLALTRLTRERLVMMQLRFLIVRWQGGGRLLNLFAGTPPPPTSTNNNQQHNHPLQ